MPMRWRPPPAPLGTAGRARRCGLPILRRLSRPTLRTLACYPQARRPRGHDLERSCAGRGCAGRASARDRSARADPRANQDPHPAARAVAQPQADQPAQRLSAYRHRHLHQARHHRLVRPASGHALLRDGRADMGPDPRGHAPNPAADVIAQGGHMADRRRQYPARPHARPLRLWPHRARCRRLRPRRSA